MRLVQVMVPAGKRDEIVNVLTGEGIDYAMTDETSGREYTAVVYFPLPENAVESVLDQLAEAGFERDAYTVIVDAETVISDRFDKLQERYAEEEDETRIARQELQTRARELVPVFPVYIVMTVISSVVATAGVLINSSAIVVGSMVIAPLLGPAISASVGTVTDNRELFTRGLKLQVLGLFLAIASSTVFAVFVRYTRLVPPGLDVVSIDQINVRLAPSFLELAVALAAGAAGALSLSTGISTVIVGALIAVALIPPIAVFGIGVAWGEPMVLVGTGVLIFVNIIAINLAALGTLWLTGYRPDTWVGQSRVYRDIVRQLGVLVALILLLSVFLGSITYASYERATFETTVNAEAQELVTQPAYENIEMFELRVVYDTESPFRQPELVIVEIGRPPGERYPQFAERLNQRITESTGRELEVEVRFIDVDRA